MVSCARRNALQCTCTVHGTLAQVRSELPGRCAEVHQGRLRDASPPDRSTSHFHMQQHKFIPAETIDLPSVLCIRFLEPKTLMF